MIIHTLKNRGFSLIELAVVLFIISLILGGLLPPLATQIEQRERESTQGQLDEIKQVIYGYVLQNRYLPCPDCRDNTGNCAGLTANDGVEDTIGGPLFQCATSAGNLPWSTLGVKETDAWGRPFTYRVTDIFADRGTGSDTTAGCTPTTTGVSFALCSNGDINIFGNNADAEAGVNFLAQNVPAIVVSHGANWSDTPSDDEEENYEDSSNANDELSRFVYRDFSSDEGNEFDDLMIWISPHVLRTKMLNAGLLP